MERLRCALPPNTRICLAVKANAYGHGAGIVARHAQEFGVAMLAVATVEEALELREQGIDVPILTIAPVVPEEAEALVAANAEVTIEDAAMLDALADAARKRSIRPRVHVEIDTGMARHGVGPAEFTALAERLNNNPNLEWVGVCHHFVDSLDDAARTAAQQRQFDDLVRGLPPEIERHEANSAAAFTTPREGMAMARIGIGAYGYGCPDDMNLLPVLRWRATIRSLRSLQPGQAVSYGAQFVADRPMRVATLGVGYGDGYPRQLSNRGHMMTAHGPAPILGRVCMDQIVIDVTPYPNIRLGDVVDLIGPGLSADDLAQSCNTISYEILTQILPRVPRIECAG